MKYICYTVLYRYKFFSLIVFCQINFASTVTVSPPTIVLHIRNTDVKNNFPINHEIAFCAKFNRVSYLLRVISAWRMSVPILPFSYSLRVNEGNKRIRGYGEPREGCDSPRDGLSLQDSHGSPWQFLGRGGGPRICRISRDVYPAGGSTAQDTHITRKADAYVDVVTARVTTYRVCARG